MSIERQAQSALTYTGSRNFWTIVAQASHTQQNWTKSTQVHQVDGVGCLVRTSHQQTVVIGNTAGESVTESVVFVPGVKLGRRGGQQVLIALDAVDEPVQIAGVQAAGLIAQMGGIGAGDIKIPALTPPSAA